MIVSFTDKGLRKLFEAGSARAIIPEHTDRLRLVLAMLETAEKPEDLALPGLRLKPFKKNQAEFWSVRVTGNWLVTFRFKDENVCDVDYVHTA